MAWYQPQPLTRNMSSSTGSLENTLAVAIKNYRNIVDSRRFIPSASMEEFKKVFDEVFTGLLDSLITEAILINDDYSVTHVPVDAKKLSLSTDILKILIILKHFIDKPVYADELLHNLFELIAKKDLKIISATTEFDDHKATQRFETFLVNLYVLLSDDSSIKGEAESFLRNLSPARLQVILLDAAPRASQEEMYRKCYRQVLLNISNVNDEIISPVIKRLEANYPEDRMIEGITRKEFLLSKLGWKKAKVYNCADHLHKRFMEASKNGGSNEETLKLFGYFWILLEECKFVAPDECCSTLFIFPSECETFLKYTKTLSESFKLLKITTSKQAKALNNINMEISTFVRKLVKAVGTNYIHFERDLNNRNYQNSNKILSEIVVVLTELSQDIFTRINRHLKEEEIEAPVGSNKVVHEFVNNIVKKLEIDSSNAKPNIIATSQEHTTISIAEQATDNIETKNETNVPFWALMIAVIFTIFGWIFFKNYLSNNSNEN